MPETEIEKRYDSMQRIGDTLVVDIFIPDLRPGGAFLWAKASPLYDPQGNISGAIETIPRSEVSLAWEKAPRSFCKTEIRD